MTFCWLWHHLRKWLNASLWSNSVFCCLFFLLLSKNQVLNKVYAACLWGPQSIWSQKAVEMVASPIRKRAKKTSAGRVKLRLNRPTYPATQQQENVPALYRVTTCHSVFAPHSLSLLLLLSLPFTHSCAHTHTHTQRLFKVFPGYFSVN